MLANQETIPQVFPWLGEAEIEEVKKVFKDNWLTEGPRTKEFGTNLNALMEVEYGVFAPNGTLALFLGLLALGVGPGDEVIVPDTTFIGSANAVILTGATPVFLDVNRYNFQINLDGVDRILTERTKAVMPVHLFGMSANMEEVMGFADIHGLKVIEDAAQGIGVRYSGQHTGTFGDMGCFSFFADKTITTGEGGYVACKNKETYETLLLLRNQGRYDRGSFIHPAIGYNFRITDLQAAVGLVQLKKLPQIIGRKLENYSLYRNELSDLEEITFLEVEEHSSYVPFRVVILVPEANKLMSFLDSQGIQTRSFFYPLHKQPCFVVLDKNNGGALDLRDDLFPNSIYGYEHGVCLPIYPSLSQEQVRYICSKIKEFYPHG